MKLLFALLMVGTTAAAESSSLNLAIPSTTQNYQSDKFRTGELDCSNAIGSATNLEFGVTGIIAKGSYDNTNQWIAGNNVGDVGVFARITIPLGKRVESRIDCNKLYELELEKKQLELQKLQEELQALKALQFE